MNHLVMAGVILSSAVLITGCETTNAIPYKASTQNVIKMQQSLKSSNSKVKVGDFTMGESIGSLGCRLLGPVKVAPGKTIAQYIQEAFQEELFMAQVYDDNSSVVIDGTVEALKFSSVSPAYWDVTLKVKSDYSAGYSVSTQYKFGTSYGAYRACENVADAFGPTVQKLINDVVSHPGFIQLTNN